MTFWLGLIKMLSYEDPCNLILIYVYYSYAADYLQRNSNSLPLHQDEGKPYSQQVVIIYNYLYIQ